MWGMDWIELAQDRDRWRALVYAVMNLTIKCGEFLCQLQTGQPLKDSAPWSKKVKFTI
jgi:hypothetical protein